MFYHGIDLIETARIATAIERWGERFTARVFTENELRACEGRVPSLAARFAAKEAVAKLLGVGIQGLGAGEHSAQALGWREIEVRRDDLGRPTVVLYSRAAERAQALGIIAIALSLSHTREHAIASAVAEG